MTPHSKRGDTARIRECGFAQSLTKPIKETAFRDCMLTLSGEDWIAFTRSPKELNREEPTEEAIQKSRPAHILVAEDNFINQKVALKILEKLGYRAEAVANGEEAIKALKRIPYDLVLMDCQMPELDGFDATRAIRGPDSPVLDSNIPIIAMTANAMKGDRERCLEAGMDDYIAKPVQPQILVETIEQWLSDRPVLTSAPLAKERSSS
jgi:CheY-like chemotaxis protein